jgi:hypothetical protein
VSAWLLSLLTVGARTRPSFLLRLGYLLFCWRLVAKPGGVEKLQAVAPYVLAGLGETPTAPLLPPNSRNDNG